MKASKDLALLIHGLKQVYRSNSILLIFYKIAMRVPLLKLSSVEKRRLERPNVEIQAVTLVKTS